MADRGLQFVSFEGKRTTRLPPSAAVFEATRAVTGPYLQAQPDVDMVRRTLACCGLDPDAYRLPALARRVPACLRTLEARSQVEARALIERRPDARARALGAFLISVTGFFRDGSIFDQVQRVVIPSLAARAGMLRAWSAGCANGSELYSLAILLAEAGLLTRTELVGTDCRPEALREARDAVFDAVAVERLDRARLARFFDRMPAARWRAAALLRAHASWRSGDITRGVEPGSWDVILWRNVAIYLRPEPALAIARRLVAALAPGGFLVLGRAERLPSGLGVRRVGRSLYQQVGCEHVA